MTKHSSTSTAAFQDALDTAVLEGHFATREEAHEHILHLIDDHTAAQIDALAERVTQTT